MFDRPVVGSGFNRAVDGDLHGFFQQLTDSHVVEISAFEKVKSGSGTAFANIKPAIKSANPVMPDLIPAEVGIFDRHPVDTLVSGFCRKDRLWYFVAGLIKDYGNKATPHTLKLKPGKQATLRRCQ